MYQDNIVVSIHKVEGKSIKEYDLKKDKNSSKSKVFMDFGTEYEIKVKNKGKDLVNFDVYIDGSKVNVFPYLLQRNQDVVVDTFENHHRFLFAESENGEGEGKEFDIEVRVKQTKPATEDDNPWKYIPPTVPVSPLRPWQPDRLWQPGEIWCDTALGNRSGDITSNKILLTENNTGEINISTSFQAYNNTPMSGKAEMSGKTVQGSYKEPEKDYYSFFYKIVATSEENEERDKVLKEYEALKKKMRDMGLDP